MRPSQNLRPAWRRLAVFPAIFLCLVAFAATALAQPASAPRPPKLRFLFLDESPGTYFVRSGKEDIPVSSTPYSISAPFAPPSFERVDLYRTGAALDPVTGQPVRLKVAGFNLPVGTPLALVVVTPRVPSDQATPATYAVDIIDGNPNDFPAGSIRLINRGQASMAARFGATEVMAAAGETRVVRPKIDGRGRVRFKIAVQAPQAGGWQMLQDSLAVIRPQERMIGLLVYSPGGMKHLLTPGELAESGPPPPGHFWLTCTDSPEPLP